MLGFARRRRALARQMRDVSLELSQRPHARLVVIAGTPERVAELHLCDAVPVGVDVSQLVGLGLEEMDDRLSAYPGSGLVVLDARPSAGEAQLRAFERLFLHLERGDVWIALRSPRVPRGKRERLVELAGRFGSHGPQGVQKRWREHRRSMGRIEVETARVLLEKNRPHLRKLREAGAVELLNAREPELLVTELASLPAGTIRRPAMTDVGSAPEADFPDELAYPEARVRRYDGRVALPAASVALHGRSVLPDSFRWHLAEDPVTNWLRDVDARFARPRSGSLPPHEHLPGSYYFFGYNNPGHFGHLMTEAVAKLWGWDAAKAADPSLKILCREHPKRPGTVGERLENVLLPAYGIDPDDIAWATGPVTVDDLVGATPLWHNAPPHYVHPALVDDWRRLRAGLPQVAVAPRARIFVTRHEGTNRWCRNGAEVESLFASHGFDIVRPETLTLAEQAAVFAQARVVAGYGGSGMFNLLFAGALESLIVLNQSSYWGRSEHLFATALGVDSHFFWSVPDEADPDGGYTAHQSAWKFDFARNRGPLESLLGSL
ncbi:MAG TPA: glycosyltransferase family 61 protein [Nocardioides sp.]|nr:glycosyltransferase family 61 protein [Nocardioides sp.]